MGRIHASGARHPYSQRDSLDATSFGERPRAWLIAHDFIPHELRPSWISITEQAMEAVHRCYSRAGDIHLLRLHGDCHPGNLLWTDQGPHFVDFDDSRMGPALQDLWMLLSGDRAEMSRQLVDVLAGYESFFEFDERELHLLEALRTLRLLNYSAWLAMRWEDPAFPLAFPWFNSVRYWQDRILEMREQVALMDEPPLWSI
jgi:Ser/Thr protein kinase RdoA (MazF antagonist)